MRRQASTRHTVQFAAFAAVFMMLVVAGAASGQNIINTVAGGGQINNSPTQADIAGPTAVVEDAAGNKYVAAPYPDYIFELTTSGTVQPLAGLGWGHYNKPGGGTSGPASEMPLYAPTGLAMDTKGNVYVADSVNNVIRKVFLNNGTYDIVTVAGQRPQCNQQNNPTCGDGGPPRSAYLSYPEGVGLDKKGNLYIADTGDNVIRIVSGGTINRFAGNYGPPCPDPTQSCGDGGPATGALLNGPIGVAADSRNNLYIADTYDNRIRCVLAVVGGCGDSIHQYAIGDIITVAGTGTPCTSQNDNKENNYCGDGGPATQADIGAPRGVSVDESSGTYYITDTRASRVRMVSPSGTISNFAGQSGHPGFGGDNGPATQAMVMTPNGVYVDAAGNVLIADTGNQRIREVTGGVINTILGGGNGGDGGGPTSALLENPYQVVFDAQGDYYIADAANNRIRCVAAAGGCVSGSTIGSIYTVAGTGNAGYSGDGMSATDATLNSPLGLALDASGDIFISDTYNGWVREVNATTGVITTLKATSPVTLPEALAIDSLGNLFIADPPAQVIWELSGTTLTQYAGNGISGYQGDCGPATSAELSDPTGVAIDTNENLYIADSNNNVIRCVLGKIGGCGDTAQKCAVGDIVTYAYDGNTGFSGDGGPATQASRYGATEVAVDASGNLFISGGAHDRVVQRVDAIPPFTIITVAGDANYQPGFGFSGDGGPASLALINSSGLALDSQEDLLIADNGNNRIREAAQLIAVVDLKPKSLNFGSVPVGQQSQPQKVTLENIGLNDLSVQISIGGTDPGDFGQTNNCPSPPAQIPPLTNNYSSCTITVTFTPTQKGGRNALLTFTDNGYQSPQSVPLSGTGD